MFILIEKIKKYLHMDNIFHNNWNNIYELKDYVEQYYSPISQGFFTKVYQIDNDKILKINCGDPDIAFNHYYEYFKNKNNIHAPKIFNYKLINDHYYCLTEKLSPFPNFDPEHKGITFLRNFIKGVDNNVELEYTDKDQVYEIYDFIKDLDLNGFSIDICQNNIMLRDGIWILNDPIVKINY